MEISEELALPETLLVFVMNAGNHGICRLHVCVDMMVYMSGKVILVGWAVVLSFITGAPRIIK